MLAYLGHLLEEGSYTLDITVTDGAEALSGTEQTISVEHLLCGLEGWRAAIAKLLALFFGLSGTIILVWVVIGLARYGLRKACSSADMAEDKGIPYQSLINLYLRDCAQAHRDLKLQWQ